MATLEIKLLDKLKYNLKNVKKLTDEDFWKKNGNITTNKAEYYLKNYLQNINCDSMNMRHKKSYSDAQGGELRPNKWGVTPMAALRSSAALAYNIFGNKETCELVENPWGLIKGEYSLTYEWKEAETIKGHRANIDVHLSNEEFGSHMFVEMKMFEPLAKSHPFKSYERYITYGGIPEPIVRALEDFDKAPSEYFDAFQMIKHLLALYNYFKSKNNAKKVVLVNCHWEPKEFVDYENRNRNAISLKEKYERYNECAKRFMENSAFVELFEQINVELFLDACSHFELLKALGKERDEYLKRYEI